jgi:molybdate transport system permease protein
LAHAAPATPLGRTARRRPALVGLGGLLAAYLLVPVALVVTTIGQAHAGAGLWSSLRISLLTATIAVGIIAAGGVPLGWLLARRDGPGWRALGIGVQLPLALPPLVSGLLLLRLVGPYTWLGRLTGRRLTDTMAGIIIAQVFVAAPFAIVAARSAFAAIDPSLDAVAATLGHRPWSRWWRVDVASAGGGIRAGLLLAWLRAFGEFGATVLLAYHPYSLPVYTYVQFGSTGIPATHAPVLASVTAALAVVAVVALRPLRWVRARARRVARPDVVRSDVARPPAVAAAPAAVPAVPAAPAVATRPVSPAALSFSFRASIGTFHLDVAHRPGAPRLALLGPSGAGKSLTLSVLGGVRHPDRGWVRLGDEVLTGRPSEERGVGYVPQSGALLPASTVWGQATFGVRTDPAVAAWWLDRLGLAGLGDRYPAALSGGQAQRVALARALASDPRLLLLDEPLSALDSPTRRALRAELRAVQLDTGIPSVIVTHDPEEAAVLADEIIVIDHGTVLAAATTRALFTRPPSLAVADLLGMDNVLPGAVLPRALASLWPTGRGAAEELLWSVPPEGVMVTPAGRFGATVADTCYLGRRVEAALVLETGLRLVSRHPSAAGVVTGQPCRVDLEGVEVWGAASPGGDGVSSELAARR